MAAHHGGLRAIFVGVFVVLCFPERLVFVRLKHE
jgi:hypothetical protein